ncbi:hypothetical protein VTI74DRAFT_2581 [Chaetomium olivicolor]
MLRVFLLSRRDHGLTSGEVGVGAVTRVVECRVLSRQGLQAPTAHLPSSRRVPARLNFTPPAGLNTELPRHPAGQCYRTRLHDKRSTMPDPCHIKFVTAAREGQTGMTPPPGRSSDLAACSV